MRLRPADTGNLSVAGARFEELILPLVPVA
jgi:hypothetical protein